MISSVHLDTLLHASLSLFNLLIIFSEGFDTKLVVSLSSGLGMLLEISVSPKSFAMLPLLRLRVNIGVVVACTSKHSHKLDIPE